MTDITDRLRLTNADFLHEEAAEEIERLRAERDRLRVVIRDAVDVITSYDPEVITCTIWLSSNETLVDYLRSALGEDRA